MITHLLASREGYRFNGATQLSGRIVERFSRADGKFGNESQKQRSSQEEPFNRQQTDGVPSERVRR